MLSIIHQRIRKSPCPRNVLLVSELVCVRIVLVSEFVCLRFLLTVKSSVIMFTITAVVDIRFYYYYYYYYESKDYSDTLH